jgi:WD40 repeat protein
MVFPPPPNHCSESVLYSYKDRAWKLADFGISSEITTGMITLYSKGTPGYRAPELLLEYPKYSEKVDIWALGCILYELVVGTKPFSSDIAVSEYRHSQSLDLEDCEPLFKDSILEMLQMAPESRPTSARLYTSFSRYYRDSAKASQPGKLEIVTSLPESEEWRTEKLTWAEPNTDVVFVDDTVTEGTEWTVLAAIVNKPTTRVATISIDDGHIHQSVKLWNITGELLWEKQEVLGAIHEIVQPTFSEDGKHLAVYSKDVVEIIDARRAVRANKFPVKDTKITAISIARNGRTLAIATDKSHTNERLDDAYLSKEVFDKPVDVVTTILISNVSIAYLGRGRRLFAVGKPLPIVGVASRPLRGFSWDLNSRALLQKFNFGNSFSYFESSINIITLFNEPCLYMRIGHLHGTAHCSALFYTAEGRLLSETHESRCVHGVCPQGIVYIRSHEKLEIFDSKKRGEIASIQSDELPPILEIKALGVLEERVIVVADDERFIFLRKH